MKPAQSTVRHLTVSRYGMHRARHRFSSSLCQLHIEKSHSAWRFGGLALAGTISAGALCWHLSQRSEYPQWLSFVGSAVSVGTGEEGILRNLRDLRGSTSWCEIKPFLRDSYGRAVGRGHVNTKAVTHGVYDVCVVGGGIVGAAAARQIAIDFPNKTIAIVDKEPAVARHQTGHNSGVIHAGIYYKPGSDMARCCVDGAKMMFEYCGKNGVPCQKTGKLIVAGTKDDYPILEELLARGIKNGVEGLEIVDAAEIKRMEPNVTGYAALHSPNTGIADFAEATRSFARDLQNSGRGEVILNFRVDKLESEGQGEDRMIKILGREPGQAGPDKIIMAKNVVTCCGTHSDKVAMKSGGSIKKYRVTPFRGRYYQMAPEYKDFVKRNIYPVPNNKAGIAVGVHFTPVLDNSRGQQLIIGPGCCMATHREGYRMTQFNLYDMFASLGSKGLWVFMWKNFTLSIGEVWRDFNSAAFIKEAQRLVPACTQAMIRPSFSGVMAQVFEPNGTSATDFIYEVNAEKNMIHVRNAPSPACTASMAIAMHISKRAQNEFGW